MSTVNWEAVACWRTATSMAVAAKKRKENMRACRVLLSLSCLVVLLILLCVTRASRGSQSREVGSSTM